MSTLLQQVLEHYPAEVKLVHKDNPLQGHPLSRQAAIAALAAGEQNKYWEYHDMLMANMQSLSPENFPEFANALGLDMNAFQKSLSDPKHAKHVDKDSHEAINASAAGSPCIFVNGQIFNTRDATLDRFKARIDEELKKKKK